MWQALVFSHGGTMLNADEKQGGVRPRPAGQKAIATLRLIVDDGTMRDVSQATMFQDFVSGRLGIWTHSTSRLGGVPSESRGVFRSDVRHAIPLGGGANARLPAGGNVAMMFTKDPAKQKAAWEYIKFATGPVGATIMVKGTGYFPANRAAGQGPEDAGRLLRARTPTIASPSASCPSMTAWYAFPGENGLKITDVIKDHLQSVVNGSGKPDEVLKKMTADTQALLPK